MVFWRDWKGWLKGGIIYTLIVVVLFFVGKWIFILNSPFSTPPLLGQIFLFPFFWIIFVLRNSSEILIYVLAVLQAFIIGALIGLIISKFKKNRF